MPCSNTSGPEFRIAFHLLRARLFASCFFLHRPTDTPQDLEVGLDHESCKWHFSETFGYDIRSGGPVLAIPASRTALFSWNSPQAVDFIPQLASGVLPLPLDAGIINTWGTTTCFDLDWQCRHVIFSFNFLSSFFMSSYTRSGFALRCIIPWTGISWEKKRATIRVLLRFFSIIVALDETAILPCCPDPGHSLYLDVLPSHLIEMACCIRCSVR